MKSEALFFKKILLVFLAFYLSAFIIFLLFFLIVIVDSSNFSDIGVVFGGLFGLSLISSLVFFPVLFFISLVQWWIKSKGLKIVISFVLMIIYGSIVFGKERFVSCDKILYDYQNEILVHLSLTVPSTILFLIVLHYMTNRFIK